MVMYRPLEGPVTAGEEVGRTGSIDQQLLLGTSDLRSDGAASSSTKGGPLHGSATAGVQGAGEEKSSARKSPPGAQHPNAQLICSARPRMRSLHSRCVLRLIPLHIQCL